MRKKLKSLGLRLTELSSYLGFSRPTLYKYLEDYDKKRYSEIDYKVKRVFDFVMKRTTISKISVINYIIKLDNENDNSNLSERINSDSILTVLLEKILDKYEIQCVYNIFEDVINEKYYKGDVKND